jgi:hypothetical protein
MDRTDYERLVPSIGGGAPSPSYIRRAVEFPRLARLTYDEAYAWVEALGWYAFQYKETAEIHRSLVEAGVPRKYVGELRRAVKLERARDVAVFAAFYQAGVPAGYAIAMHRWTPNTVLRFYDEGVDIGYGQVDGLALKVTVGNVILLQREGVPPDYAVPLLRGRVQTPAVIDAWRSGIPLEYALQLGAP